MMQTLLWKTQNVHENFSKFSIKKFKIEKSNNNLSYKYLNHKLCVKNKLTLKFSILCCKKYVVNKKNILV